MLLRAGREQGQGQAPLPGWSGPAADPFLPAPAERVPELRLPLPVQHGQLLWLSRAAAPRASEPGNALPSPGVARPGVVRGRRSPGWGGGWAWVSVHPPGFPSGGRAPTCVCTTRVS